VPAGNQFACFTALRKEELEKGHCYVPAGTQFTCFTSTKVQILTLEELRVPTDQCYVPLRSQFTFFTATKVQVLTMYSAHRSSGGETFLFWVADDGVLYLRHHHCRHWVHRFTRCPFAKKMIKKMRNTKRKRVHPQWHS